MAGQGITTQIEEICIYFKLCKALELTRDYMTQLLSVLRGYGIRVATNVMV
jgi:hypothetical protein